jgi:hypothetical protein
MNATPGNPSRISYFEGDTDVQVGDHVTYRSQLFWWRWKPGRISYVPGVSALHAQMEHNGLQWVGVSGIDGTFRGVLVEPGKGHIQRGVRFQARSDGTKFLSPHEIPETEW